MARPPVAGFRPRDAAAAIDALRARGFDAAAIGRAETGDGVRFADGAALVRFERDEVARVLA